MIKMELCRLSAYELLQKLKNREITGRQILASIYERIEKVNPRINAYVRVGNSGKNAFSNTAGKGDELCSKEGALKDIPVSIKDNISTSGYNTECCSEILKGFKPPYDATVIKKLKQAGALILDIKTNMDEFAFGSSTENSSFGTTRNPWDAECVAGGSSGGAAASVSADEAILALGSDTGGSVRQPASFCGVVGMKPTYGRVSRFGLIAFASSLDQIGPITKNVRDNALLMNAISGFDPCDSTSVDIKTPDYTASLGLDIKGIKIGIPKEYFIKGLDPEIKTIVGEAINKIESMGAKYEYVSLPRTEYAVAVYYIIATAEASSNLARFDAVRYGYRSPAYSGPAQEAQSLLEMYKDTRGEGFGEEAKRRIILGTFVLSYGYYDAYYLHALKARTLIKQDFDAVFKEFDCIITPTSPTAAFRIGEKIEDPLKMYLSDIYTISANLAGIPAISIPCGFTKDGLPAGLQILAKPFNEEMLFRLAYAYEQNTPWHKMKPEL